MSTTTPPRHIVEITPSSGDNFITVLEDSHDGLIAAAGLPFYVKRGEGPPVEVTRNLQGTWTVIVGDVQLELKS